MTTLTPGRLALFSLLTAVLMTQPASADPPLVDDVLRIVRSPPAGAREQDEARAVLDRFQAEAQRGAVAHPLSEGRELVFLWKGSEPIRLVGDALHGCTTNQDGIDKLRKRACTF